MPYHLRVRVLPADIDELDHANNQVYLRWVQDAALAHSSSLGLGYPEYLARGAAFVVRRHEIDYLRPAVEGDELDVATRVAALGSATSERRTVIRRAGDGALIARAVTRWAFIDLRRGRPTRIPDDIRDRYPLEPIDPDDPAPDGPA